MSIDALSIKDIHFRNALQKPARDGHNTQQERHTSRNESLKDFLHTEGPTAQFKNTNRADGFTE